MATWKTSRSRAPERLLGWPSRFYGLPNCGMAFAGMHQDPSDLGACANAEFRSEPRHQGEVLPRKNLSDHFWHLLGKSLRESVDSWLQQTGLESTDRLYLYGDSACMHPISSALKSIAVMSKFLGSLCPMQRTCIFKINLKLSASTNLRPALHSRAGGVSIISWYLHPQVLSGKYCS